MPEITLVKTTDTPLPELEREAMARVLFGGYVDGMSEDDKTAWRKFWSRFKKLEAGELVEISAKVLRNGKFHRKFMKMVRVGFEYWEPNRTHKTYRGMPVEKNFERFREEVTILAGYYEQTFDLDGNLKLVATSLSFASMEQEEFEQVYSAVADVLLQKVLHTYKDRAELDDVVEKMLRFL